MFGAPLGACRVTKLSLGYDCGGPVRDDPNLPGDHGHVPISEQSGRQFNSRHEISSLFGRGKTR